MSLADLGMIDLHHVEMAVDRIDDYRPLLEGQLSFTPLAVSTEEEAARDGQRSRLYAVGRDRLLVTEPLASTSRAGRFLRVHPAGVMSIGISVEDAGACFREIVRRDATPVSGIVERPDGRRFAVATPLGDVELCFVERRRGAHELDGLRPLSEGSRAPRFPWLGIDHITANTRTAAPVAEWYRRVLGCEDFFSGEFHTAEPAGGSGSGFKWKIVWHPKTRLKLATNEPLRPNFALSQIEQFVLQNRGPGVQHLALAVPRITDAVAHLRQAGASFLPTPAAYYDPARLRARARASGWDFDAVAGQLERMRDLHILVDGSPEGYLLQIFQVELDRALGRADGSPFFFEVIQREGDQGFGHGTFRALFEAIEASQGLVREQGRATVQESP